MLMGQCRRELGFNRFPFIRKQRLGITSGFEQKRVLLKPSNNSSLLPSLKARTYRNPESITFSRFPVFPVSARYPIHFVQSPKQKRVLLKPSNNSSLLPSLKARTYRNPESITFSRFPVFPVSARYPIHFVQSPIHFKNGSRRYRWPNPLIIHR